MKTALVIIILTLNWLTGSAQFLGTDIFENISKKDVLKNKVKEISTYVTIDTSGKYSNRMYNKLISKDQFDSLGNKVASISFDSLGKVKSESFFEYDLYGRQTLVKHVNLNGQGETIEERTLFKYKNKKPIKEWKNDSLYIIEYFYNKKGLLEKTKHTNKENKVTIRFYKYDEHGNETESFVEGKEFGLNYKRTYDHKNNKIEETTIYHLDTINKIYSKWKYHYNDNGLLVEEEFIDGYATSSNVKYEYDLMNNLTVKQTGDSKILYYYDTKGNRIKKITNPLGLFVILEEYKYQFRR
jgi:hypothetical protein